MPKAIILSNRPTGKPRESDFKIQEIKPPQPGEGEMLLKALYMSVDPYMRNRMRDEKSYIPPFKLNEPITTLTVAEVIESKNPDFQKGDFVYGMMACQERQTSDGKGLYKVDPKLAPLSAYLGVLGMTGLTAYFGLLNIGQPQEGDTLVVSAAAGAVGSVVGQIAKLKGCQVIGIAGSDEKLALIKDKFGFDAGINYKTTRDIKAAIAKAAPNGVDVYFDNVGGEISDAVWANIASGARVVACGAIAIYNSTSKPEGPRLEPIIIKKSVKLQGFTVGNYSQRFGEGMKQLGQWLKQGKLDYSETVREGFEQIPSAFIDLFEGKNKGKMVVAL